MSKLAISLLFGLQWGKAASADPVCVDASLDRVEYTTETDGYAVLDVPEYPSINVPMALAAGIPEGAAVKLCGYVEEHEFRFYLTRDIERERKMREEIRKLQQKAKEE